MYCFSTAECQLNVSHHSATQGVSIHSHADYMYKGILYLKLYLQY